MDPSSPQTRRYWLGGKRHHDQDRFFEQALNSETWQPGDDEYWHACWYTGMPKPGVFKHTGPDRKINHIPGNNALTVKSRLHDTLVATRKRVEEQFGAGHDYARRLDFLPRVFSMPRDYHAFQQAALENPDQSWILKPKNAARGKGIRLVSDVADIPMEESWMVQEYLRDAHTMHGHKYVLRLYVLISSIEPLRVYLYHQGFAKLASAPYDINDTDNVYSHLTNPDINALNEDAEVPVEFVDFEHYRQWLRDDGHDDEALFERIHDLVTLTCISAAESMRKRTRACGADPRGCYELLGLDCLVDTQLKPWILECNLSPSMGVCAGPESGGIIEEQVKRQMVTDMVSLVGLNGETPDEGQTDIVAESQRELERAGGFLRLYPNQQAERYIPYFALPRLPDMLLAQAVSKTEIQPPTLQRRHGVDIITEDQLAVYEEHTGRLNQLNETAAITWLMAMEGHNPDQIAETLFASAQQSPEAENHDYETIRNDVWNSLADWATSGLLMQQSPTGDQQRSSSHRAPAELRTVDQLRETTESFNTLLVCGGRRFELFTDSKAVITRLRSLLLPLEGTTKDDSPPRLEIVRDTPGYTLILAGEVIETRRPLSALAPLLFHHLALRGAADNEMVLDASLVTDGDGSDRGLIFIHSQPGFADALAAAYREVTNGAAGRGLRLDARSPEKVGVIGFPLQLESSACNDADAVPEDAETHCHRLLNGSEARLIPAQLNSGSRYEVGAVVIPDTRGALGSALYQSVSVAEALRHLLPQCHGCDGQPLDAQSLTQLTAWLEKRPCLLVDPQRPEGLAEALRCDFPKEAQKQEQQTVPVDV